MKTNRALSACITAAKLRILSRAVILSHQSIDNTATLVPFEHVCEATSSDVIYAGVGANAPGCTVTYTDLIDVCLPVQRGIRAVAF